MAELAHLEKLVLVGTSLSIFSGKAALDDEETPSDGGDVVDWGSKWVIDPKLLKPFHRLKTQVERLKIIYGTKTFWGCATVKEKADILLEKLGELEPSFDKAKTEFINGYSQSVREWAAKNPRWHDSIIESAPPVERIERRMRFRFARFGVTSMDGGNGLIEEEIDGLAGNVAKEIAKDAKESFGGDGKTTQRVRAMINRIRDKALTFSFLDSTLPVPALGRLVETIDDVMRRLPDKGVIQGADYMLLSALMSHLSSPSKILAAEQISFVLEEAPAVVQVASPAPLIVVASDQLDFNW